MTTLEEKLFEALNNFRVKYINCVIKQTNERSIYVKSIYYRIEQIKTTIKDKSLTEDEKTKLVNEYNKIYNLTYSFKNGEDNLKYTLDKNIGEALRKFNKSIDKLAEKIETKGLDIENIKITATVDATNLDMTISDNNKTVTVKSIIAWGEIQKAHYRFIVR